MAVIPILFLALNIAFPVWLWSGTSTNGTSVEWTTFEKNLARLIESDGGFPHCSTLQVVDVFHTICEDSFKKLTDRESMTIEHPAKEVVFACEFRKESIVIKWFREGNPNATMECLDPGGDMIPHAPGFVFIINGRIKALEFTGDNGVRQRMPYRNCRLKAKRIKNIQPPPVDLESMLESLGKAVGDPADFITANHMCFLFDSSPLWRPWRRKFLQ